jgi:hypothetical protein
MLASKQLILTAVSATGEITEIGAPANSGPGTTKHGAPKDRRKLIFAIVSIGLFTASVDQTNVTVSLRLAAGQGSATGP